MGQAESRSNRNTLWASVFVEELRRAGIGTACVSPGSRSTPLTLALARQPGMTLYTHIDERSGAFFALGHAKATGRPVVLVCTSGTAAANFHPAVIEAAHAQVPLIVLTADRPAELRDTGAGQTMDQLKLYGGAVRWFFEVGPPEVSDRGLRHLRGLAGRAVFEATRAPAGPVHLNFPFGKPLEPIPVAGDVPPELERRHPLALLGREGAAYSRGEPARALPAPATVRRLAELVRARRRGLILCGPMSTASLRADGRDNGTPGLGAAWAEAVAALARQAGYPVLAEPPSQVRAGTHDTSHVIAHGEAILRAAAFRKRLAPELVLRFGSMPTAAAAETLLDEHPACPVVLVHEAGSWLEPTHHPAEVIQADPAAFCLALAEALGPRPPTPSPLLAALREADRLAAAAIAEAVGSPEDTGALPEGGGRREWFEGRVFSELGRLLPAGALLCTASSMPVRDLDAFSPVTDRAVRHLVNRGVNGIDGTLSAALGAAAAWQGAGAAGHGVGAAGQGAGTPGHGAAPAVLVTGDLAFLHDSNGLLAAKLYGIPLTIILINNDGGGIFEMLPVAAFGEAYERHFGTPHGLDFAPLCAAYGVPLLRPRDWAEFRTLVGQGLSRGQGRPATRVIELRTERRRNRAQHLAVWEAVARRIEAAFPPGRAV